LQFLGQTWIKTVAHTATLTLLPILTFIITKVISGNIALSLGMVGALSIVRFRNPVRSPLELSVYFGAITMGIAAAVSHTWVILLACSVVFATCLLLFVRYVTEAITGKPFFNTSFSEGNSLSTFEITATSPIQAIELDEDIKDIKFSDGLSSYVIASSNFDRLQKLKNNFSNNPEVLMIQLRK